MDLQGAFDTFNSRVELSSKAVERIDSAEQALSKKLTSHFGLGAEAVFLQGSYENGTAVTPAEESGEYDVDLVVEHDWEGSPDDALAELEEPLAADGTYADMLEPDKACVCLRYAEEPGVGGFHVDLIPARPPAAGSQNSDAPLEVARRNDGWHGSDPRGYTTWCRDQGEEFARTVKQLKRWRAVHQPEQKTIKSIVLQVLAAEAFTPGTSDAHTLAKTLEAIKARTDASPDSAPEVFNPTLPSENLTESWSNGDYADFRKQLDDAVDLATRALASTDTAASHDLWIELLGDDFPPAPSDPAKRSRREPTSPPPGHQKTQAPPRRDRYGS